MFVQQYIDFSPKFSAMKFFPFDEKKKHNFNKKLFFKCMENQSKQCIDPTFKNMD